MSDTIAEALSCQELVELVTAYLEGALSSDEHTRFEAHLATCGSCRVYIEQMRETIRLTGRLTPEAIPPAAEQALLEAFRSWHAR
jgi:anti-sigma factor RsiW